MALDALALASAHELDVDAARHTLVVGALELFAALGPVPSWRADAACAEPAHRGLAWFPEPDTAQEDVEAALAVCRGCLVTDECAALGDRLPAAVGGVWGGTVRGRKPRRVAAGPPVLAGDSAGRERPCAWHQLHGLENGGGALPHHAREAAGGAA